MLLTLVLLSIGGLLFLIITYNVVQQYRQKVEADRRALMARQKMILDETEELLLNSNRLPFSKALVLLMQNRILDALKTMLQSNPNLTAVQQRVQDLQAQINHVQEHYQHSDEGTFRTPDSDQQALHMLQAVKKIRAVVRIEHNKGKLDPQSFALEDRRLELMQLKINIANLLQRAASAQMSRQFGSAKQMLNKGLDVLSTLHDKDAWIIAREEEMRQAIREMDSEQEEASAKQREEILEKEDDLDVIFQPKKKW